MEPFEAYHARTSQQHQEAFDRLSRQGFRMISLNVYGGASNPRYNAVWVQRAGAEYLALHNIRGADYQVRFDQAVGSGYSPVLVTATGSGNATVFAAFFERGVPGPWLARHNVSLADLERANVTAAEGGMALRSLAIYGTSSDRRYAAVWHTRPAAVITHLRPLNDAAAYQQVFDAETSLPFFRPRLVALADDQRVAGVFSNDVVGRWVARHSLTAAQYQEEFDRNVSNGLVPICVSAGGAGSNARFAAIFADSDITLPRIWTVTGTRPDELVAAEQLVEDFMKNHSVRCGQLTILRSGEVALERAYTWSEPGTRQTSVNDLMLLASCSKIFVNAAVQRLYDWVSGPNLRPRLSPRRRVYPLLAFRGPADPKSDRITIQQLLDHKAGYTNDPSDPTYDMRTIATELGLSRPPTATEVAWRIYTSRALTKEPGKEESYSNFGYLVASLVVEHVSGMPFLDFVREHLLAPLGISDVAQCPTAGPDDRPANQVVPEDDGLGPSALHPTEEPWVPAVFGGDGMYKESAYGSCGIASSATALARFIHQHAVKKTGGRMIDKRDGNTPGARAMAVSRAGDVDWVLIFNTRMNFTDDEWFKLIDQIDASLDDWAPRRRPDLGEGGSRVPDR